MKRKTVLSKDRKLEEEARAGGQFSSLAPVCCSVLCGDLLDDYFGP
jgi:hypothetical protein